MKALILSLEGQKAIVLLRGGEMRTVRAHRDWSVGQEVDLSEAASHGGAVHRFLPLAACAVVLVLLLAGMHRLSGNTPDSTLQPLSPNNRAEETAFLPDETPAPTLPLPESEASPTPAASNEYCDECGKRGHDDDDCPDQICDECGKRGHDDDDCPDRICDECGKRGHDDDDCPDRICDECGKRGHDDDDCPYASDDD